MFQLAMPALGEQLLAFCVGLFDTWLAGQISTSASTAVGLAAYVDWLATLMFNAVGIGTSALVARHWGAKQGDQSNLAYNQAVPLALVIGAVSGLFIFTLAPYFAHLQGLRRMSPETEAIGIHYLRLSACGHLFHSLTLVTNAGLRGAGDMRTPLSILAVVNGVNILASSSLVFGWGVPSQGIYGIVLGTLIARIVGFVVSLLFLLRGRSGLRLEAALLFPRWDWIQRMLRIGIPAMGDGLLMWVGHFLFIMIIANLATGELGRANYAAHMVAINIEALTYLPAVALGTSAATLVGHSLGAGQPLEAWRYGQRAAFICGCYSILTAVIYFSGAGAIFRIMHRDPLVQEIGSSAFRYLAIYQIPLVFLIVYTSVLRGAGDTRTPVLFTILGTLLVRLPVAYLCGIYWHGGLLGAWTGMMVDVWIRCLLATTYYYRGAWLKTSV
ncbi:MAG: MATE family efflux transporter [Planctomycetales bacterium]